MSTVMSSLDSALAGVEIWVPAGESWEIVESQYQDDLHALRPNATVRPNGAGLLAELGGGQVGVHDLGAEELALRGCDSNSLPDLRLLSLPVRCGDELVALVLFILHVEASDKFSFEWWSGRPAEHELRLRQQCCHGLERFGKISQHLAFPHGSGLPGRIWATAVPQVRDDLTDANDFLRSSAAKSEGLTKGFGLPVITNRGLNGVMLWLWTDTKPLFHLAEVWRPHVHGEAVALHRAGNISSDRASTVATAIDGKLAPGQDIMGRCWSDRRPILLHGDFLADSQRGDEAKAAGLQAMLAIPSWVGTDLRSVLLLAW